MALHLPLDTLRQPPGHPGQTGRSLVPMAPAGLPAAYLPQVDASPYLATPPPQFTESFINLAELVGYMRRFGWLGFLAGLALAALAFYALGMGTPIYEAEAKLRLRLQDTNVFNFNEMGRQSVTELSAPQLINNHLTEIKSRKYLEYFHDRFPEADRARFIEVESTQVGRKDQLLKLLGLYKPGIPSPPRETFMDGMSARVRVEPQKDSHILRVLVRHPDPGMAARIANAYATEYMGFFGQQEGSQMDSARTYLEEKAAELRQRLQESEAKLAEYRKSENLLQDSEVKDVAGERVRLFTNAITDAQVRLFKAQSDLRNIQSAQQAGRDLMEVRVVADNAEVAYNRKELDAKIAQRKALEPMCGRRHPMMIALANEIETLKMALDRSVDAVVAQAQSEVTNMERQVADYQNEMNTSRSQSLEQSGKNIQQNLLRDQVAMDRELYQKIVLRLNQATVTGQFTDSGALALSDVAAPPNKPVKPNKPVAALASLFLFGVCFIGLPVGWGLFNDHVLGTLRRGGSPSPHIPSARQVPHMPLQPTGPLPQQAVHAALPQQAYAPAPVPVMQPPAQQQRAGETLMIPAVGQTPVLARLPMLGSGRPEHILGQILKPEPQGAAGALQQLTSTLEMHALRRGGLGGVILITSAEAGEGKTLSAAALAAAFCHQGRSVFLLECNPVAPALHEWFPHSARHSSWAHDMEALRYGNTHLFLLPAHDLPAYATTELLEGYRSWIDRARQQVDWIILDAGPVLRNFADVAPLAPLATDVLLVNNPRVTNAGKLRAALHLLQPMMASSAFRGLVMHG
ncbi:MAG TPA: hypothetical protein PK490_20310 [Prosthecobacter sp.]|nr:hypothetical protein [Prosthecobacter sp.]HRK16635.1 hypothetical protein [Prosthecobacter sp.]